MEEIRKNIPVLFVSHGSPLNAILKNPFTHSLQSFGRKISHFSFDCIISISAHWITEGTKVTGNHLIPVIHDFSGFPEELYRFHWRIPGNPELAKELSENFSIEMDMNWGMDHGSWTVLKWIFPEMNIPFLQISIDKNKTFDEHFMLGKQLSNITNQYRVLVLCSGSITHNLSLVNFQNIHADPPHWAVEFDQWIQKCIEEKKYDEILNIHTFSLFDKAHPEPSHFIPLLYWIGFDSGKKLQTLFEGFQYGSLSMRSMFWH